MAGQYREGQKLQGSDGQVYVVHGGQPVLASSLGGGAAVGPARPVDPKAPYEAAIAATQLANARAELAKKQRELANDPNNPAPDPYDALTGDDYLKHMSQTEASQVRALADGRMAFPTGKAASSPYWQKMLGAVAHYDPSFDGVNYTARASARKDFTSGTSARNIRALNTAIGHVGQLSDQIDGTASHGGFPFATTVNAVENAARRGFGDSGPTNFDQTRSAVASELTQVFRGSGGAEADVKRYLEELSSAGSAEQKRAAIRNIAGLLNSRLSEIGDQYSKAMGKTTDPVQLLNPHAQQIWTKILGPDGGAGGGHGPTDPSKGPIAGGDTKFTPDEPASKLATELVRSGMSDQQVNAALQAGGFAPLQTNSISSVRAYLKQNPGFKGPIPGVGKYDKTSLLNKVSASAPATLATQSANALFGGMLDEGVGAIDSLRTGQSLGASVAAANQAKQAQAGAHPTASFAGNMIGGGLGMIAGSEALGGLGLAARLGKYAPAVGNAAYGATYGAGESNDNRLLGAGLGAGAAVIGDQVANRLATPLLTRIGMSRGANTVANAGRRVLGRQEVAYTPALTPAEKLVANAAGNEAGNVLPDAQSLNLPFTLADVNPATRALAGASVRRSPNARQIAETTLLPRGRGQFDRLQSALDRDTVPGANIPEQSAALIDQARTNARAAYPGVYESPVISTPELDSLLGTPSGRGALGKAMKIAGDERRTTSAPGFALDEQGNAVLNPVQVELHGQLASARAELDAATSALSAMRAKAAGGGGGGDMAGAEARAAAAQERFNAIQQAHQAAPASDSAATVPGYTTQTLDYVKGGLDDMVEAYRDPATGILNLNREGNATNQVRSGLLAEMDKLNPGYSDARAAYAGPAGERDWFLRGSRSTGSSPDQIGFALKGANSTNGQQFRLGYRSGLDNQLGNIRYANNPWETAFGSPNAQERMSVLFPEGAERFGKQYGLEGQMAQTQRSVLGGSDTAERGLADKAFDISPGAAFAIDAAGALATGAPPIATGLKIGRGLLQSGKDRMAIGGGRKKADELAPLLFGNDPMGVLSDMVNRQAIQDALAQRLKKPVGMFGSSAGLAIPSLLNGY